MNLVRWEPFSAVDDMFNRVMPAMLARMSRVGPSGNGDTKFEWVPSADIIETEKEYLIRAELPAVKKEDVRVTFDQGTITIEGERKLETDDRTERYHRRETLYGTFMRSFSLPETIEEDGIHCEIKDGVLVVHIPKAKTATLKSKQIKVD